MTTLKSMPRTSTGHRARCIAFMLFIGSSIPLAAQAAQEPQGVLTLYQTVDNNTELSCSFDVPATGSDTIVRFYPRDPNGKCKGNETDEKDKLFQPHSIRIRYAPAAARIILSDKQTSQLHCSKDGNWIELETTRPLSSLEKMGLDNITDYTGYVTNIGSDTQARSIGFKRVDSKGIIPQGKLNCIEVKTLASVSSGGK